MKFLLGLLLTVMAYTISNAKPITATVVFENLTEETTINGIFYIKQTNQQFDVTTLESFQINLPNKGSYEFQFHSEIVSAYTYYPSKITEKKNTITIRLEKKSQARITPVSVQTKGIAELSNEELKQHIAAGTVNFIVHGLVAIPPDTYQAFKKEYGIGFISENCALNPQTYKTTQANNKVLAAYLTSEFGEVWKSKLPAQPFGIRR